MVTRKLLQTKVKFTPMAILFRLTGITNNEFRPDGEIVTKLYPTSKKGCIKLLTLNTSTY